MTTPTTPDKSAPEKGMLRYTKKPVTIDAWQFTEAVALNYWENRILPPFGCTSVSGEYNKNTLIVRDAYFYIDTLEGKMRASLGDWIIKGVKGEIYPCKPDIFDATYNPAQETGQQDADYEGTTPSSQKGGCDYMSFSDAKKLFQKYIDCEIRDPNGLDELAKAMLSYNRAISRLSAEKNYVGEETLAQELREENDRLSFKMQCNSIKGKTFTMKEARHIHKDREEQLAALTRTEARTVDVEALKREVFEQVFTYEEGNEVESVGNQVIDHLHAQGHFASQTSAPVMDLEDLKRKVSAELEQNELDVGRVIDYLHAQGHLHPAARSTSQI